MARVTIDYISTVKIKFELSQLFIIVLQNKLSDKRTLSLKGVVAMSLRIFSILDYIKNNIAKLLGRV